MSVWFVVVAAQQGGTLIQSISTKSDSYSDTKEETKQQKFYQGRKISLFWDYISQILKLKSGNISFWSTLNAKKEWWKACEFLWVSNQLDFMPKTHKEEIIFKSKSPATLVHAHQSKHKLSPMKSFSTKTSRVRMNL